MQQIKDLRALADARLFGDDLEGALHAYALLLGLQPSDLDARLRVADSLLALGEVQRAAEVYAALARHAAHGGYPLRALVALKILSTLEPQLGALLRGIADLYAAGSPRLGRGVRLSPGDPEQALPPALRLDPRPARPDLIDAAARLGVDLDRIGAAYPALLPPIPLLSELPADSFAAMLEALSLRRVRAGETVVAEGEPGDAFYVLARGEVRVSKHLAHGDIASLASLHDGAIFGEMALVSDAPRTATVTAVRDCDLLVFDRSALAGASRLSTALATALDKFTRERLLHNLLATAPLFRPLEPKQRFDLARRFTPHDMVAGTDVIREGERGRGLFVLLSGEVDVWKVDGEEKVLLATLGAGEVFGEISLLKDAATSASVTAARDSTVLFLAREYFQRLVAAVPAIRAYVEGLSEGRLMDTQQILDAGLPEEELGEDDLVLV